MLVEVELGELVVRGMAELEIISLIFVLNDEVMSVMIDLADDHAVIGEECDLKIVEGGALDRLEASERVAPSLRAAENECRPESVLDDDREAARLVVMVVADGRDFLGVEDRHLCGGGRHGLLLVCGGCHARMVRVIRPHVKRIDNISYSPRKHGSVGKNPSTRPLAP